jgi:hypothetical protein
MTFDDEGYEWCEVTNFEQKASGQRMFIKGRPVDRTVELTNGIEELIGELGNYEAIAAPEITLKLRALL